MGYNTDWNGILKTSRPFTQEELHYWKEMSEMRHDSGIAKDGSRIDREFPSIWCDFDVTNYNDKTGTYGVFKWNGSEKTYEGKKWIKFFLNKLKEWNKTEKIYAYGDMEWRGDEEYDMGRVSVVGMEVGGKHTIHIENVELTYKREATLYI